MSNVNQLRNMWQSKVKQPQPANVPIKNPQVNKTVQSQKQSSVPSNKIQFLPPNIPKKTESSQDTKVIDKNQPEIPRQSVAQLRKNLQQKLGPIGIMGLSRHVPSNSFVPPKNENTVNIQSTKESIQQQTKPVKINQRMPTFLESKMQLQNIFQRKKYQNQGYQTGAPNQNNQAFINLSGNNQSITPEQRTDQVMKRIFSAPQSTIEPKQISQEKNSSKQQQNLLSKQQQITTLNLRAAKKQKVNLGDFDDF